MIVCALITLSAFAVIGLAASASAQQVSFNGMVYYGNVPASHAAVSVDYGMKTYTTSADSNGSYSITLQYAGGGKAIFTASYNGDIDTFTWSPAAGSVLEHDFWITPRLAQPSQTSDVVIYGRVFYNGTPVKGAHVIIVYGKYLLDQYTNSSGYYDLTVYYQGTQARIWATYSDGKSDDYWKNPLPNSEAMADLYITPASQLPVLVPSATPEPSGTPGNGTPTALPGQPTSTAKPTPAGNGFTGLVFSVAAIGLAFAIFTRRS